MTPASFSRPASVAEALALLADPATTPLAGGTDYFANRVGKLPDGRLVDLSGVDAIKGIDRQADGSWRIGAGASWTSVLLALDAMVELAGEAGTRLLPLAEFITGPRRTARRAGELLTAIVVPATAAGGTSHFAKLGARRYLLISIVMAAANVDVDAQGRIARAAVAVGACSPVARRLAALERRLVGMALTDLPRLRVRDDDLQGLDPLDDIRATRAYRLEAAAELVRRVLVQGCKS